MAGLPSPDSCKRPTPQDSFPTRWSWNSSRNEIPDRYFEGFFPADGGVLLVWAMTKVLIRSYSFLKPVVKSRLPYSKKTMKQKVKNRNSATQKRLRSRAMPQRI